MERDRMKMTIGGSLLIVFAGFVGGACAMYDAWIGTIMMVIGISLVAHEIGEWWKLP